jgi:hypothetical protein
MKIKELIFNEEDQESGILAISFVENPAIEKDFIFFNQEDFVKGGKGVTRTPNQMKHNLFGWKFWKVITVNNEPWEIDTSRPFCKHHANPKNGRNIFHIDEIRSWNNNYVSQKDWSEGWITQSNFCQNFTGTKSHYFKLDKQMYNCRHAFTPIEIPSQVPPRLRKQYGITLEKEEPFQINFSVTDKEQRIIRGVAMIPNILIYRRNQETNEEFYVFFSKDTIKKLKDKYGFNREITIQHQENITGNAILLNSWIYPEDKDDNCGITDLKQGSWCLEYKILNEKLWEVIKNKGVKGFSVEALLPIN